MPLLNGFIKEQQNGTRLQKNGTIIRKSTIKNYLVLQKHLHRFTTENNFNWRLRNDDDLNSRGRKIEHNYWKNFYFKFSEYLYKQIGAHDNYAGVNFKLLRAFFNYINTELLIPTGSYHNRFYITREDIPVIVLYPERFHFLIYNMEFENSLPKYLRKYKDMFVFGCTTALRFSDLVRLHSTNIEKINNNVYVSIQSQKTGIPTRVYLPQYAKDILVKYKRRKKSLFPLVSKTNFNKAIKKIAFLAGWTEEMSKTRNVRGEPQALYRDKETKQNYRFCDLVSSHTMRRTAITTLLQMGMNEINVRIISGHKANSPSFYRYVSYADSFMDDEMDKIWAKLAAIPPSNK